MVDYHDREWGVPVHDDRTHFEFLVLEGAQAGLSWSIILRKRDGFRRAFSGFVPEKVARYTRARIETLVADPAIVRNRLKIEAAVANARALLLLKSDTTLTAFLWGFLDGRPVINRHRSRKTIPAVTEISTAMSKGLKARGFRFVGPTTIYAFMQSAGMVNDHLITCHRHGPCAELQRAFKLPGRGV